MASKCLTAALFAALISCGFPAEKRGDDPQPLEPLVEKLANDVATLQAKVAAQETQNQQQENEIQLLKAKENQRVSFAAYVTIGHALPATANEVIRFGEVVENTGHAYSNVTGAFTAPYDGGYAFLVSVDVSSSYDGLKLEKNGQEIVWGDNDGGADHVTTGAVLALQAGDLVTVNHRTNDGSIEEGRESVFVGYRVW